MGGEFGEEGGEFEGTKGSDDIGCATVCGFSFFSRFGVGDKELIYDRRLLAQQEAKS